MTTQEEKKTKYTLVSWASSWTGYKDSKPLFIRGGDVIIAEEEMRLRQLFGAFLRNKMLLPVLAPLYIYLFPNTDTIVGTSEAREV